MEHIIKPIIKVGNSGGVLVPKDWINGSARVELITKPLSIKKDIFDIINNYLEDVLGIYIVGSYARGEETERSDVDVLVITNGTSKKIKKGRYDILLIPKNKIEAALESNAFPLVPMLIEAKTIINKKCLDSIENKKISNKNLKWNISMIKSALKINQALINFDKNKDPGYCSDAVSYSLVLNLRSIYIIDCLRRSKKWSTKGFISLIRKISGSLDAYMGYLRVKNGQKTMETLPIEEAENLFNYISKKLKGHEKWLKAKNE